jgi:chaperonin cofactor prefoldin
VDNNAENTEKSHDDIIKTALERFKLVEEGESQIRKLALEDLKFRAGEQWPSEIKTQRQLDGRPCLVINRLPQFIRQVTNDQRQNRPSIKVYPVDDNANIETSKILQGMIRHIEYNSNADIAYDTAFESAATTGRGFFRIITDYADPMSFDQEILIKRVRNPLTIFLDPHAIEPDGSDANWCLIADKISKKEFKKLYPKAKLSAENDWSVLGASSDGWLDKDICRIAEYFTKEFKSKKILLLSNGDTIDASGVNEETNLGVDNSGQPITVKQERSTLVPVIHWYKITAHEVLEETIWPGQWIPIVPVYGDELDIDGERRFEGIVTHAKDPQRMYNYWSSNETELIALAPRTPWIGAAGQFEGYENQWQTANKKNHSFLEYKPVSLAGQPVGPPVRNNFEPPVAAITNAKGMSADDMKATTGIYDSALGNAPNDTSGIAIQRRNTQAQVSNFHFIDNMSRALRHAGRIIVDLIPEIYDTPRMQRIVKDDGTQDVVPINQVFHEGPDRKMHNLSIGKYDVVVETGPSYATKRQEAANQMEKITHAYPQLMNIAGDLMLKNMDWPGASEMAERFKKTIPPNLLDDKNKQIPPQVQAQMQQMQQMITQLSTSLQAANQVIENKKLELASKERIELSKIQASAEETLFIHGSKAAESALEQEIALIDRKLSLLNQQQSLNPQTFGASGAAMGGNSQQQPIGGQSPS